MLLNEVIAQIGGEEPEMDDKAVFTALSPFWETSLATLSAGPLSFLTTAFISQYLPLSGYGAEHLPFLEGVARQIEACPALRRLAWHAHRRLVFYSESGGFATWPALNHLFAGRGDAFYFLIALAALPHVDAALKRQNLPTKVIRDTERVVESIAAGTRTAADRAWPGVSRAALNWMRHHIAGRIFRIGRMEWLMNGFSGQVHVYRHRETGAVCGVMAGGIRMTPDGFIVWNEEEESADDWTTAFAVSETEVLGSPVREDGSAAREPVRLPRSEWEHRLSPGMPHLDMHIPAGGGMSPAACRESFQGAVEFFDTYFPSWYYTALGCRSWILNPGLQSILPPEANLVKLQKAVCLYPCYSGPTDGLRFVFGVEALPEALPETATKLQRSIFEYLAAGHRWRGSGMFLLKEDVPHCFAV